MLRASSFVIVAFSALGFLALFTTLEAKNEKLPSIPGATLLLGWPPHSLVISAESKSTTVQEEPIDWYISPSISSNGNIVASVHPLAEGQPVSRPRLIVGTYSVLDKRWTDYKDLHVFDGSIAISADGSKLACITRKQAGAPAQLRYLDVRSATITAGPERGRETAHITWSPDGRRLAFDGNVEGPNNGGDLSPLSAIYVWDLESGTISKIAAGESPSWSPSSEWIAFLDYSYSRGRKKAGNANRVSLVRPDGTDSRVIAKFGRNDFLNVPPVWSPDSKKILISNFRDDNNWAMDIYALDLATLKLTKKFKDVPPVYAWIEAKPN